MNGRRGSRCSGYSYSENNREFWCTVVGDHKHDARVVDDFAARVISLAHICSGRMQQVNDRELVSCSEVS